MYDQVGNKINLKRFDMKHKKNYYESDVKINSLETSTYFCNNTSQHKAYSPILISFYCESFQ